MANTLIILLIFHLISGSDSGYFSVKEYQVSHISCGFFRAFVLFFGFLWGCGEAGGAGQGYAQADACMHACVSAHTDKLRISP